MSLSRLTRILRAPLDEGVSICNLRAILDTLLMVRGTTSADFDKHVIFAPNTGFQFPAPVARSACELLPSEVAECVRRVSAGGDRGVQLRQNSRW